MGYISRITLPNSQQYNLKDNEARQSIQTIQTTFVKSVNGKSGDVVVDSLPNVTASDNSKYLRVLDGHWVCAEGSGGGALVLTFQK